MINYSLVVDRPHLCLIHPRFIPAILKFVFDVRKLCHFNHSPNIKKVIIRNKLLEVPVTQTSFQGRHIKHFRPRMPTHEV